MQRGADELNRSGGDKLRDGRRSHVGFCGGGHAGVEVRREQGREVEGGEYGQAVAQGEEGEGGQGHGPGGRCGAEELGELRVFVQAEGEVGAAGCEEFGRARGRAGQWCVVRGAGERVDAVGGEVGAEVEGLGGLVYRGVCVY